MIGNSEPNEMGEATSPESQKSLRWLLVNYVWIAAIATLVDTGILVLLRVRIGLYVWLSAALGYLCGMAANFLLNKYVNFASKDRSILRQARTFFIVASIGLALTSLLMEFFVQRLHLPLLVAKAISIAIVMFWSFWGHKSLTFKGGIRQFVSDKLNRSANRP